MKMRRNKFHLIGLLMFVAVCSVSMLYGQQAVTRIEGKIVDEVTGNPIGCKILVYTPSGKKNTLSSNASDGTYLVVVNEAGECRFLFAGYNVYRYETKIVVPPSTKFQEIKKDIKLKEVIEGTPIASVVGFEKNSAQLNNEGSAALASLVSTMNENQELNININVGADADQLTAMKAAIQEEYEKDMKAWEKAVKKVKKGKEPPEEPVRPEDPVDPNIELVKQRKEAIKQMLMSVKNSDLRVTVGRLPDPPVALVQTEDAPAATKSSKQKKGKKSKAHSVEHNKHAAAVVPTLVVTIGKVKRLYD